MNHDLYSPETNTILTHHRGIEGLQSILFPQPTSQEARQFKGTMLIDLDDTTKESIKYLWKDGKMRRVLPETVAAFLAIHNAECRLGTVTEQAFTEIEPWLTDVAQLAFGRDQVDPYQLFDGLMIGEGGAVGRRPQVVQAEHVIKEAEVVILAPPQSRKDREIILKWLKDHVTPVKLKEDANLSEDGWCILEDVDPNIGTYVQIPKDDELGIATLSLWKKGLHVSEDSSFVTRYDHVDERIRQAMIELGVNSLKIYEAGNGTGRIVPKRIDKARTLSLLSSLGAIDRNHTVYACDGPNDVKFAQELKVNGGGIIAVGNAVSDLRDIADYPAQGKSGLGFAEAVAKIIPDHYAKAFANLHDRGLL